jgi:hypothetical protein
MFSIYEDEGEALTEQAKVKELLEKVQHASLSAAVAQLRFQLNTVGVTFTVAANHLNAAVSLTPDYQMARRGNISSTNTRDSTGGRSGGRSGYGHFNNRGRGERGGGRGFGRGNGRGSGGTPYKNKSNST